jgi:hypothetical protein
MPSQMTTQYITETQSHAAPASLSGSTEIASSTAMPSVKSNNSFFDSKGKVAGTFTAVGIVAAALICAFLYFFCCAGCCGFGGRYAHHSDEEQGYSSDEGLFTADKHAVVAPLPPPLLLLLLLLPRGPPPPPSSSSNKVVTRNNSNKSVFLFFVGNGATPSSIGRTSSKKKLLGLEDPPGSAIIRNPAQEPELHAPAADAFGDFMIPIAELDHRLDPRTVFLNKNESKKSLSDEHDYSRRILKITNPE